MRGKSTRTRVGTLSLVSFFASTHSERESASRFLPLIEAEQEAEENVIKNRLARWGVQRLINEGYCIRGMQGTWLEKRDKDDRPSARFALPVDDAGGEVRLPTNAFTYVRSSQGERAPC